MKADNIKLAVFSIVVAVLALSLGDALIKAISADFPLWQIFVLRSALCAPVLLVALWLKYPDVGLLPTVPLWSWARSALLMSMWLVYYAALPNVELSVAAAAYYTLPLFITLLSSWFVGDRVGIQGWLAVCLGFVGVLMVLKPQADDFNAYALLPLISAVCYALAMILTRTKCRDEHPLVLSLALNIVFIVAGLSATILIWAFEPSVEQAGPWRFLIAGWVSMDGKEWLAMFILAGAVLLGSVLSAIAYQSGPSALVSTFDFSYLAFAAIWGLLFFAEVPDAITAIGIVVIALAGILAVRRPEPA